MCAGGPGAIHQGSNLGQHSLPDRPGEAGQVLLERIVEHEPVAHRPSLALSCSRLIPGRRAARRPSASSTWPSSTRGSVRNASRSALRTRHARPRLLPGGRRVRSRRRTSPAVTPRRAATSFVVSVWPIGDPSFTSHRISDRTRPSYCRGRPVSTASGNGCHPRGHREPSQQAGSPALPGTAHRSSSVLLASIARISLSCSSVRSGSLGWERMSATRSWARSWIHLAPFSSQGWRSPRWMRSG